MLTAKSPISFDKPTRKKRHSPPDPPLDHQVFIYCIHDIVFCNHGATTIAKLAESSLIRLRKTHNEKYNRTRYWAEYNHSGLGWIIYQSDYEMLELFFESDNDETVFVEHSHDQVKAE